MFLFDYIRLICFICANFLFCYHYYCITMCSSHVSNIYRSKNIIRRQQHQQHEMVGNIYLYIAYFLTCLPPYYSFVLFVLSFSLLLYYNISVAGIDIILHNIKTQQQQQHHRVCTMHILIVKFTFCSHFVIF